jgi:disulfide bond formation protein DsbB
MRISPDLRAGLFAGAVALSLLLGALTFQYVGGLPPCEMCHWQRWPHIAAALFGLIGGCLVLAGMVPQRLAATLAIIGVEWMWWQGPTHCTGLGFDPGAINAPNAFRVVRCDVAAWRLFGISLAGYNALFSLGAAGLSFVLLRAKR